MDAHPLGLALGELAIEIARDQGFVEPVIRLVHRSLLRISRSRTRAACRRDITVPSGIASTLGDLAVGQVVVIPQHDDLALLIGKS